MIIAIDGPAGAGKSTVARRLAEELGFQLIDTGAMFRTVAFESERAGLDLYDEQAVAALARRLCFEFRWEAGDNVVYCNGVAMQQEIRSAEVSRNASIISALPAVRQVLLEQQREVGRERSSVLEGRDIGTVIFPDAELKAFITASPEVRAERRVEQMCEQGLEASYDDVLQEILDRDRRDSEREVAPLRRADDAIALDSTEVEVEEIVQLLLAAVHALAIP
ncbi:MAG: (d)CMP kinase [Bradymonadaceae bacterium]|nr:(d)CMP kinase [Lujinxingiaceae bacterium]